MSTDNKIIQFVKDALGTRKKYHDLISSHDFTDFEKDILLQASANINNSNIDTSLLNAAYNILISKSIQDNTPKKNYMVDLSLLKYLLIIGFLFALFYIIILKEPDVAKKSDLSKQENVSPKQISVVKVGDITGQGFLRTQGGSIRTCAGNEVYIERSNPNGLLYLSEILQNKKDHLVSLEKSLDTYKGWLIHSENMLKTNEHSLRMFPHNSAFYKDQVSYYKERVNEDKQRISEQKKEISAAKKVLQEYEAKVENSIKDNILKTMCDAQGNYSFPKLKVGKYYIRTVVQWYVGDEKQGGIISKIITIKEGKNKIMLTE